MTKEEKIKEAWGDNYSKDVIMEGRRCGFKIITNMEYISIYKGGDWYCEPDTFETIAFMPTTLRQILKNNGWIKIESEDDLPTPKLVKECYFISLEKNTGVSEIIRGFTDKTGKYFICSESYRTIFYNDTFYKITHYQPIEKPKPPIY